MQGQYTTIMQKEKQTKRCPVCCVPTKRLYIRVSDGHGKQKWKPIGYYCEICGVVYQ